MAKKNLRKADSKKLGLSKETLRQLAPVDLAQIVGGGDAFPTFDCAPK